MIKYIESLPDLFKDVTNEKGSVSRRIWKCDIYDDRFITFSGIKDGKLIPKETKCNPKNIGRSNETTITDQTKKEAQAKWTKKVNLELYKENPDDGVAPLFIAPMLALDYSKVPKRLKWGKNKYCVQPKLNGVRFTARMEDGKVVLRSRKGKVYSVEHLEEKLIPFCEGSIVADGELYLGHGYQLGDVTSAVKNKKNKNHINLQAWLFDLATPGVSLFCRYTKLVEKLSYTDQYIKIVPCRNINKIEQITDLHDLYVYDGYEGVIIRDWDAHYAFGQRTPALFKYKKFEDDEFEIVAVNLDKDELGAVLVCKNESGDAFGVRCKGTDEYRAKQWEDREKLIGKMLTVRYQSLFKSGVPEFPVGICVRDYE